MSSAVLLCPDCNKKLRVPETAMGKTFRCPSCKALISPESDSQGPPPARSVKKSPPRHSDVPSGDQQSQDEEPEDDLEPEAERPIRKKPSGKRRPRHKKSSVGPIIGLAVGGGFVLILLVGIGVGLFLYFNRSRTIPDAEWQTFPPPGGDCTVLMPGIPVPQTQSVVPDIQAKQYLVERKNGKEAFGIAVLDVPPRVLRPSLLEELATNHRNAVLDRLGGGQGSSITSISLGNIPGLEYQGKLTTKRGTLIGRVYLAKIGNVHRIYLLAVVGESIQPNKGDAARFLDSFKITASTAAPDLSGAAAEVGMQPPPAFNPPQANPQPNRPPGIRRPPLPRRP